jgi:chemotaxis protein histidine kinase CheA
MGVVRKNKLGVSGERGARGSARARRARSTALSPSPASEWVDELHWALSEAKSIASSRGLFEDLSSPHCIQDAQAMMRSFHLIKGFAQALGLHGVQAVAHGLESALAPVAGLDGGKSRRSGASVAAARWSGPDLKRQVTEGLAKLDAVIGRLHEAELRAAAVREQDVAGVAFQAGARTVAAIFSRIEGAARGIALDLSRELELVFEGDMSVAISAEAENLLEAALLHAVRNSLDHGSRGVSGPLLVTLSSSVQDEMLVIECRDSGAGIDSARVREAARERMPRFDAEMGGLPDDSVLQLLFLPGMSLSRGVSRLSGRGYGLDIVREAVETRLGGKARLESRLGQGTRLVLRMPIRSVRA